MACLQMLMKASRESPKDLPSDMEFLQVMLCYFSHKQFSCHADVMGWANAFAVVPVLFSM